MVSQGTQKPTQRLCCINGDIFKMCSFLKCKNVDSSFLFHFVRFYCCYQFPDSQTYFTSRKFCRKERAKLLTGCFWEEQSLPGHKPEFIKAKKRKQLLHSYCQEMQDTSTRHLQSLLQKNRKRKAQKLFPKMSYQVMNSTYTMDNGYMDSSAQGLINTISSSLNSFTVIPETLPSWPVELLTVTIQWSSNKYTVFWSVFAQVVSSTRAHLPPPHLLTPPCPTSTWLILLSLQVSSAHEKAQPVQP